MSTNKTFGRFAAARAISIVGDRVADVVLPLAVLAVTGSAATAGLMGAAAQFPQVLAALHVGVLVDRRDRRSVMITADVLRAAVYVAIGLEIAVGGSRLLPLLLLALVGGVGDAMFNAAAGSYLPSIVDDRDLMRANGLIEGSDAAATLTGPAIGGWLMQRFGPLVAFLINAATFLISAVLLWRLPAGRPVQSDKADDERSVTAGVRLVLRDRRQRVLLIGACYMHLLAAAAFLPLLVRMRETLHLSPATVGLVISAAGVGGLLSSLLLARWTPTGRWPVTLAAILAVNGAAVGVLALLAGPVWLAVAVLALDAASALAFIMVATVRQQITPDGLRGRVITAATAVTATVRMLAIAGIGALTDLFGPDPVLLGLAGIGIPFLAVLLSAGPADVDPASVRRPPAAPADTDPSGRLESS
ncbi:MFS transporter [Micromonospora sp. LOL_021]|uniref:MFS transporter n=1 Tax=Micromonospora sp. LOL_021 TaxID=3345417 RepID=UPI003A894359